MFGEKILKSKIANRFYYKKTKKNYDLIFFIFQFDGQNGEAFENAVGVFCARQQIALEWLRERRRKDAKLHNFLTECESDKTCRRLQLRDLLPTGMQR